MTPKEKAKELIDKLNEATTYKYQEYAGARYSKFEHDIEELKKCALIAVDEILSEYWSHNTDRRDWWKQVKNEIEKL